MKERPIIMSAPMVRAILAERKTQTRREMKPQPFWVNLGDGQPNPMPTCPFGVVGDRLWVRETWAPFHVGQKEALACPVDDAVDADAARYRADGRVWQCTEKGAARPADDGSWTYEPHRWRSSSTMPRWASRIALTIADVRVQRVQDITAEDAKAEGAQRFDSIPDPHPYGGGSRWSMESPTSTTQCLGSARMAFANVWININGPESWDANPWVRAITFTSEVRR